MIYRDGYTNKSDQYISDFKGFTRMNFNKTGNVNINLMHKNYHSQTIKVYLVDSSRISSKTIQMKKKNVFTKLKEFIFPK